jgi:hypothetical protein
MLNTFTKLLENPVENLFKIKHVWVFGLQIWRVAANVLNRQSRRADKGVVLQLGDLVWG